MALGDDKMSVRDHFVAALAPAFVSAFLNGEPDWWEGYDDLAEAIGFAADALMYERTAVKKGQR